MSLWKQSSRFKLSPCLTRPLWAYAVAGAVMLFWVVVGFGGSAGILIFKDYLRLMDENAYLQQRNRELDELQLALRSIREDEDAVRRFLGVKRHRSEVKQLQ